MTTTTDPNVRTDGICGVPDNPICVYCHRRARHCWGPGTGRDDHTCCIHWMILSGEEPTPAHDECALTDEVILGKLPVGVLNHILAPTRA